MPFYICKSKNSLNNAIIVAITSELQLRSIFHFTFLAAEVAVSMGFYTVVSVLRVDYWKEGCARKAER